MNDLSDGDMEFIKDILGPEDSDDDLDDILHPSQPKNLDVRPVANLSSMRSPPRSPSVGSSTSSPRKLEPSHQRRGSRFGGPAQKCIQICLGGTALPVGRTQDAQSPHFCSNLFCISCDHMVIRFGDRRWNKSTDYLFLRNNYPDKVEQNLMYAPGWCAYCCQCTFREEQGIQRLAPFSTNWVCRGHK